MHPAEQYCRDVIDGTITACRFVRWACQRHLRDLARVGKRGFEYVFDAKMAQLGIDFFRFCKHIKGKKAGQRIVLEPWQQFITWCIFGWLRANGMRRFRMAYIEVSRKNGKSLWAAVLLLLLTFFNGEPGAEGYCAATKKEQAQIVFKMARSVAMKNKGFKKRLQIHKNNISRESNDSFLEPVVGDAETLDGSNVHVAIVDEYHAHPTAAVLDVLDTGTGAREQSLILIITTAGKNRYGPCYVQREYAEQVLDPEAKGFVDESFFAIVYTLDDPEEWTDESCWIKANPNLGVSVSLHDLRSKVNQAKNQPSRKPELLRKHFCIWASDDERFIDMELWRVCHGLKRGRRRLPGPPMDELVEMPCWGGLDLGARFDLTALSLLFHDEERDRWPVLPFVWMPAEIAERKERTDRVPYRMWAEQGYLRLTSGDITDYTQIHDEIINEFDRNFIVEGWAYDPSEMTKMAIELEAYGLVMTPFRQNWLNYNEPTKEFEKLYRQGKLEHYDNPILDWQAGNVKVKSDNDGRIRPIKPTPHSPQKVDSIQATIMAFALTFTEDTTPGCIVA